MVAAASASAPEGRRGPGFHAQIWTNQAFNRRVLPLGVLGLIAVALAILIYPKDDSGFVPVALAAGGASALTVVLGLLLRRGARTRGVKGGGAG